MPAVQRRAKPTPVYAVQPSGDTCMSIHFVFRFAFITSYLLSFGIFDSVAYLKMEYKSLIKDVFQVRFVLWKYRLERRIVQTLHQNFSEHIAIIGRDC